MHIEVIKGNILESDAEAIILTVDGLQKGMEGNIARTFQRNYPDAWEELEYDFEYPIGLGSAKIYPIHNDLECKNKFCILASTLNHMDILENSEKIKVLSSALRNSLILSSRRGAKSVCSIILSGGWRLELIDAFNEMINTYNRYKTSTINVPSLHIYIIGSREYEEIETYINDNIEVKKVNGNLIIL